MSKRVILIAAILTLVLSACGGGVSKDEAIAIVRFFRRRRGERGLDGNKRRSSRYAEPQLPRQVIWDMDVDSLSWGARLWSEGGPGPRLTLS